jgi:hypothetical protein
MFTIEYIYKFRVAPSTTGSESLQRNGEGAV